MKYDYDIVIIGGGSGGLVVASSTAQMGLNVLLVEKDRLGGDCLWTGCVPSKALIAVGKRIHAVRNTKELGLPSVENFEPNFKEVMDRMRAVQATIEPHDSPERFKKLGVDVQFGHVAFLSKNELMLNQKKVTFKYGVISTGSSPRLPKIPGLKETGYLTNVDVFSLEKLPKHLAVVGGGPIGTELAQVFSRFGSNVSMLIRSKLLPKEDRNLVDILQKQLESEGIELQFGVSPTSVGTNSKGKFIKLKDAEGKETTMDCDDILLIATGRSPNVDGLQLEQAGISFSEKGITVDKYLRTSAKNIYAIGDVIGGKQFTHMAASHASTVVRNIVTPILNTKEEQIVPWVTYTDPELARVGKLASEEDEELVFQFKDNDRAIAENETVGEMRVVISPKGKILGASILGANAGELIMEYTLAMKHRLSIKDLAATIHPYPTLSGSTWTLAGSYYKRFLTEHSKNLAKMSVRNL